MQANKERLDVLSAAKKLKVPFLVIHGTADEAVPVQEAEDLHKACRHSKLLIIPDAGHTFGMKHPHTGNGLHSDAAKAIEKTLSLLRD